MPSQRQIYKAKVIRILDYTREIREITLQFHGEVESFEFQAGQFVMIHVPQAGKPALRAYSIASDDRNRKQIRLILKFVPNGIASLYVWALKEGDVLDLTGPFGRLLFQEPPTEQVVFFNTGSGVAQHISYLLSKADIYPKLKFRMYFGLVKEDEIYLQNELEALTKKIDFQYHYVLHKPVGKWTGKTGFVQQYLSEIDFTKIETSFYLCGNAMMIKETKSLLTEGHHFDSKKIFSEAFN